MYVIEFYRKFNDEFLYLKEANETLPDVVTGEDPNTMGYDTIVRRIPEDILGPLLKAEESFFPKSARKTQLKNLEMLFKNGKEETYKKLEFPNEDTVESDKKYWDFFLEYYISKKLPIVKCPMIVSELYFYRFLNLIYTSQKKYIDPYAESKSVTIIKNVDLIEDMCNCSNVMLELAKRKNVPDKKIFSIFFLLSLWGNMFDLSWKLKNANSGETEKKEEIEQENKEETIKKEEGCVEETGKNTEHEKENEKKKKTVKIRKICFQTENVDMLYNSLCYDKILCNDIDAVFQMVSEKKKHNRFDMVLDNIGIELVADLCLLVFISLYFDYIVIHVKKFPVFVSDVILVDFFETLEYLLNNKKPNCYKLGSVCKYYLKTKRWIVREDLFWNLPLPYWVPSKAIYSEFCKSDLICFKGDANYRRCLGDLKYDFSFPHHKMFSYFPSPVVLLRHMKSPLGCGIDKTTVDELNHKDSDWSNYGEYAVLQYYSEKK